MSERIKELYEKLHNSKNKIPEYVSISIRPGKKLLDFKIKKEKDDILKIIAHEDGRPGWFLHSYHIPIRNLGIPENSKNKDILPLLNNPIRITGSKGTKDLLEDVQRKYIEVLSERKSHFFRTKRFKKKKDTKMGTQMKGF